MINVTKTFLPPLEEYQELIKEIWSSNQITNNGAITKRLSKKLLEYLDIPYIELVSNGTIALQLAIKSLEIKGSIITTPFSYVATTNAIIWENCNPIFVDIEQNNFCIDANQIENAITKDTRAILATHVYGYPCDVEKIQSIANKYNLKIIYDAAHAFGVQINDESLTNFGDISILSFHATKIFHTAEGGAMIFKDKNIKKKAGLLKKFGHTGEEEYLLPGINAKLSELHSAMGICMLKYIDQIINKRQNIYNYYENVFAGSQLTRPKLPANIKYNYSYYPLVFPTSKIMQKTRAALIANNIYPRRYFYPSLNKLPYIETSNKTKCKISEDISSRILCLPMFDGISLAQLDNIINTILSNNDTRKFNSKTHGAISKHEPH